MQTGGQALYGRVICLTPASQCRRMSVKRRRQRHRQTGRQRVGCRPRAVPPVVQLVSSVVSHSSMSLPPSHRRHLTHVFLNLLLLLLLLAILANR